jgi:hypothetical protein
MSVLVRLYPRPWRDRYGDELEALLEARPPSLRDRFDVVRGAIDARLDPQVGDTGPAVREPTSADRGLAFTSIAGGALMTVWAGAFAFFMPRWGSAVEPPADISAIGSLASVVGSLATAGALLGVALRYETLVGRIGATGAAIAALGLLMANLGAGFIPVVMIAGGTLMFVPVVAGRVVPTPLALTHGLGATLLLAGMLGFVASEGQDLRWLMLLLPYGPTLVLIGLSLRGGPRVPAHEALTAV